MAAQTIVVVGGGVAGVCCVEELESLVQDPSTSGGDLSQTRIVLISGKGGFIKTVVDTEKIGQITESFNVRESTISEYFGSRRVEVLQEVVVKWRPKEKVLVLSDSTTLHYHKLCIAGGASARHAFSNPNLITIRDTQNIEDLQRRLPKAKRILVVGNGGIATELVYELKGVELVWAIRHSSISATYFDEAAAKFFEANLSAGRPDTEHKPEARVKRYNVIRKQQPEGDADRSGEEQPAGCSLGPHWISKIEQGGGGGDSGGSGGEKERRLRIVRDVELSEVHDRPPPLEAPPSALPETTTQDWKVWAVLSNGEVIGCDLVIEATGAHPNSDLWKRDCEELEVAEDGGILVDERMCTSVEGVYAAGDVCTPRWSSRSQHWFQIRLWTQARQMGLYCARSMVIPDLLLDICFDLFSHVTTFYGYKVILLGDFDARRLKKPYEVHYRITEPGEYVKVLTKDSHIHGAVLIGDTDLEEAIENLILNQTNIGQIEERLLDPEVDLEDYFD